MRRLLDRVRRRGWPDPHRPLWSLDLETTSADPASAEVLAVGMVPVRDGIIAVGEAFSSLVRPTRLDDTAGIVAHHLRPSDVAAAPPLAEILPDITGRLADTGIMLVHHAGLDVPVLRRACQQLDTAWPDPVVLDTADLLRRAAGRQRVYTSGPTLPQDLSGARRALGLPVHDAHDALADAIATAELYLVLQARHG